MKTNSAKGAMKQKLGRPKAGQPLLTPERIFTKALQLIDGHGVAAFSMRKLATALGVDPMAIYHHVPNKDTLLANLVTRVFAELEVQTNAQMSWQEQVRAFAHAYRNLARTHPNFVLYLVSNTELGSTAVLAANERLFAALAEAGLPPVLIVRTADLIIDFLNGFALGEQSGHPIGQPDDRQPLLTLLANEPPTALPTLRRVFGSLSVQEMAGSFAGELDILLLGLETLAQRQSQGGTTSADRCTDSTGCTQ